MKMKRTVFIVFWLLTAGSVFASGSYALRPPAVVDVRSLAAGGFHICDVSSAYMLTVNPALLAFAGKKVLLPSVAFDIGGPLGDLPDLYSRMTDSGSTGSFADVLLDFVGKNNGLDLDVGVSGPLTFGRVNKNRGWGVFNRTYVTGSVPSVSVSSVTAGEEMVFAGGSAFPLLNFSRMQLSVGVSSKLLVRLEGTYDGAPASLTSFDFGSVPVSATVAAGGDIGAYFSLFDIIRFGAVWKNLYAGFVKDAGTFSHMTLSSAKPPVLLFEKGTLAVGVAFNIPVGFTRGVLSSWTVYCDYADVPALFTGSADAFKVNPVLALSAGMELVVFDTIALRCGMNGAYASAGAGIDLTPFHLECAVFGKELGLDPGVRAQLHGAFAVSFYY